VSETLVADRYRLVRALGRGAVGEVWLADDLVLNRQVALKRLSLSPATGFDSDAIERIVREARVAARLHHPNVVSVFDLVTDGGAPYVVMEYVDGESLEARMGRRGPLPADEARRVIGQIAEALAAAHARGIVHRDIKPANIMIDATGTAKLADFGIARGESDSVLTMTGQTVGTIAYMAPEVARGEPATAASDIWSLGVTLFAITQGHSPYDDGRSQSAIGMLMRIASERLPPVPDGPLRSTILGMLASEPDERPTARALGRELAATAAPGRSASAAMSDATVTRGPDARSVEATLDRPQPLPRSHRRTARRARPRKWLLAAVGVVVVGAASVAAVIGLSGHHSAAGHALTYSPAALELTGDGASGAYATGRQDEVLGASGGLAVLDSSTGRFIRSIPLESGMTAAQVVLTAGGDVAYVTELPAAVDPFHEPGSGAGRLLEVRLATKQIMQSLALCGNPVPRGMVISPNGRRLLIAMDSCNEVVDTGTLKELDSRSSPGVGSAPPPTLMPDGGTGYVAEASGLIVRVNMTNGSFTGILDAIRGARGLLASPDGRYLYVYSPYGLFGTDSVRGQLAPIDMSVPKPSLSHGALTLGFGTYAAAVSPDGRYVVTASSGLDRSGRPLQDGAVTVIDTTSGFAYYPVTVAGGRGTIAFSADGKSVFVANTDGTVSKIDLATHSVVNTVHGGGPWLFRSADPDVIYASDGRASGVAIDVSTGSLLRPVSLAG
jgi:DNA-binding beta-propeller fold protein YncE